MRGTTEEKDEDGEMRRKRRGENESGRDRRPSHEEVLVVVRWRRAVDDGHGRCEAGCRGKDRRQIELERE